MVSVVGCFLNGIYIVGFWGGGGGIVVKGGFFVVKQGCA